MRIPIREQLGLLVLLCSFCALLVLALATWFRSRDFITGVRLSSLSLTANLKAAQLSATLLLYGSQTRSVATRILIQQALLSYRNGSLSVGSVDDVVADLMGALAVGQLLVQASVFPALDNGNATALNGLVNVTSVASPLLLPYTYPNGSAVYLGDPGLGFPEILYPNLTYHNATAASPYFVTADGGRVLEPLSVLLNGPLVINNDTALISATTGIINNTNSTDVLGWLTVLINASMIYDVRNGAEGLGATGEVLIVGPANFDNKFDFNVRSTDATIMDNSSLRFVLPPNSNASFSARHNLRDSVNDSDLPFAAASYPAVVDAWTTNNRGTNNAGSLLDTTNEEDSRVSVGYAQISTSLVDWVLLVESSYGETLAPINHLRDVVLICVFSVTLGLVLLTFPLAHYAVRPIRQLRAATEQTVEPYQASDSKSGHSTSSMGRAYTTGFSQDNEEAYKKCFVTVVSRLITGKRRSSGSHSQGVRREFRIPGKVPERKHFVRDELTDLTSKFNEMSDELATQYERLEERVKERTAELELSKQAAETANQSKTLFIANISHELKTPLNGILGLTTVCMNEDDQSKIKSMLSTIYKSGDLLLHLLTDLLTFSKNEVGQQLAIDEAEFHISDLGTQLIPTFEKQAKEGEIDLKVLYCGMNDSFGNLESSESKEFGPPGTGRVSNMCLWGDKNRLLQVLMNFVSNSLKFTQPGGSVTVRIKCLGLYEPSMSHSVSMRDSSVESRRSRISRGSRTSNKKKARTSDTSLVGGSGTDSERVGGRPRPRKSLPASKVDIKTAGGTAHVDRIVERHRSRSPAPVNAKDLDFEFEVEDSGPGIPVDQQKKIFEPFVQGDLGLSKKYGGTGLGLSICAQLAALMGGELSLDSEVGRGSIFSMRTPLRYVNVREPSMDGPSAPVSRAGSVSKDAPVSPSTQMVHASALSPVKPPPTDSDPIDSDNSFTEVPRVLGLSQPFMPPITAKSPKSEIAMMKKAEKEAASRGSKVRVLVAEDNKVNQEVVLRMLKLEDVYDVTIAKDGQEAFDKVRESMESGRRFHLVFMDVQMPNMDGIQSTKLIRQMGFSSPIVALTAFAEKSNEDECMKSGMDYFLAKPIKRPALKQVLKKYCATIPEEESSILLPKSMADTINVTDKKVVSHSIDPIAEERGAEERAEVGEKGDGNKGVCSNDKHDLSRPCTASDESDRVSSAATSGSVITGERKPSNTTPADPP